PKEGHPAPLEKDTILTGMSKERIQGIFRNSRKHVPYVRGVNNHMGSKATEDPEVMRALMEVLREERLYFIDSHTTPYTVGPRAAGKTGVPCAQNEKFIDAEKNLSAIKEALRSAMIKAQQEGKAVAIGHSQPLTARAIREMIPEIERQGIQLVLASEVVQ
ncbi:MAG: divergent polysaccharide deacetylase family protein, partial [Deltaproteobacteria bacterium]|nr:divergent polysaccharide deacetylase family protein [Deltaproteobacteria bacterium]